MQDVFDNPLISRYASPTMIKLWGQYAKFIIWRKLWVALAEAQQILGLNITDEQITTLRTNITNIDLDVAKKYEAKFSHDVMAHIYAYGEVAPLAKPIIHLGATSCFVTDNTDLIIMRMALNVIRTKLVEIIIALAEFTDKWKSLPCLGYTHFQPAQLVTVGKRAALWCNDLIVDLREVIHHLSSIQFLGAKGTTGTQASFLALFDGDASKVALLEQMIANAFGFNTYTAISGQTYNRKIDSLVICSLAGIAESAHKFGTDLRLLAHEQELEEPFGEEQIGSSAMAYKRNPILSERICSLAKWIIYLPNVARSISSTQWLERSLDDSAARRIMIPHSFLAADAILELYKCILAGLTVNTTIIAKNVAKNLPFMATENILMAAANAGGDRQALHERIRIHARSTVELQRAGFHDCNLIDLIRSDKLFPTIDWDSVMNPDSFIGLCVQQVDEFIDTIVKPIANNR